MNIDEIGRFQIIIDSDSVFISPAPDAKKSRVILSNLDRAAFEQLAKSLLDADLGKSFLNHLANQIYTDPKKRKLYTLYMGTDSGLTDQIKDEIKECIVPFVDSFTISEATGFFKGKEEKAVLIQIATVDDRVAYQCADKLRNKFGQEAIGILIEGAYQRVIEN